MVGNADGTLWWMTQPSVSTSQDEMQVDSGHQHETRHNDLEDGWRLYEPPYYNANEARSNAQMVMMKDLVCPISILISAETLT